MTRSSPVLINASPLPLALHASQARNLQEVLAEINRNPPGEVAIARAHRAIVDGTTESTYRQNTLREIQKLSQTVLEIEQRFATISNLVRTFDSRQAIRDENDRPVQFFPEWNEYHQVGFHCFSSPWLLHLSTLPIVICLSPSWFPDYRHPAEDEDRR